MITKISDSFYIDLDDIVAFESDCRGEDEYRLQVFMRSNPQVCEPLLDREEYEYFVHCVNQSEIEKRAYADHLAGLAQKKENIDKPNQSDEDKTKEERLKYVKAHLDFDRKLMASLLGSTGFIAF